MTDTEAQVERVARALLDEARKPFTSADYFRRLARAAIAAMQSDPIPVYRHEDGTEAVLREFPPES